MAELSGFFNALNVNGVYDRKYNANDYSENLAVLISNGVLRSQNDDLRVTANGMILTVGVGRAWINGRWYRNTAPLSFTAATPPAGGSRYDAIVLRYDNEIGSRRISLRYVQGVVADNPKKPAPVREGEIFEIVLAYIFVGANATSVSITDARGDESVCGWVYSTIGNGAFFTSLDNEFYDWLGEKRNDLASVTLFKRYEWNTILDAAATAVSFDIPQFDEETSLLDVYVNGFFVADGEGYTRSGKVLHFVNTLVAGTEISVRAYKSIDGTGILSVADEITQLQNDMAAVYTTRDYDYICNGVDDNVKLSQLAQAWLEGGDDDSSRTIRVYGTFGAQAAYSGSGTAASPYKWIRVGIDAATNRRIAFDFSNCSAIELNVAGNKVHHIFAGKNAFIIGARVLATQTGVDTVVRAFDSTDGAVYAKHCYFNIHAAKDSVIGCTGTFANCRGVVANLDTDSFCFQPQSNSLLRVIGGEYNAYTGNANSKSAIVGQSAAGAVSILDGVNAPTSNVANYYQTHALYQTAGGGVLNCRDLVTLLPVSVNSGSVQGTIAQSKAGNM